VDVSLLEHLIAKNKPFRIETASGCVFDVPHRDFLSFSPKKTSLLISFEEGGNKHFAIVPVTDRYRRDGSRLIRRVGAILPACALSLRPDFFVARPSS
jgi:hypothetical protein